MSSGKNTGWIWRISAVLFKGNGRPVKDGLLFSGIVTIAFTGSFDAPLATLEPSEDADGTNDNPNDDVIERTEKWNE